MKLLKYSNSWGHLIMSVALLAVAVFLLLQHDPELNGVGISIVVGVQALWISGKGESNATQTGPQSKSGE